MRDRQTKVQKKTEREDRGTENEGYTNRERWKKENKEGKTQRNRE